MLSSVLDKPLSSSSSPQYVFMEISIGKKTNQEQTDGKSLIVDLAFWFLGKKKDNKTTLLREFQ